MTFTLYNAPQSTCSQRVRFVLNAKGVPFEEIKLDLLAGVFLQRADSVSAAAGGWVTQS